MTLTLLHLLKTLYKPYLPLFGHLTQTNTNTLIIFSLLQVSQELKTPLKLQQLLSIFGNSLEFKSTQVTNIPSQVLQDHKKS